MEIYSDFNNAVDEPMELPPGFRFHPTDEELITHYLSPKVVDTSYTTRAIGDVDLNKVEPWDLPWMAKMGEKEWYFFCVRDRKYPTGLRTNRATEAGYWKATGKDKEIYRANILVGMKKTLVFYRGRAPRGEKTNWVMHEYRLEGKNSMHNPHKVSKNEWVICRVFKKSSGGKKVHISGLMRTRNSNSQSSGLPALMELSSDSNPGNNATATEKSNVTCFSQQTEDPQDKFVEEFSSCSAKNYDIQQFPFAYPRDSTPNSSYSSQNIPFAENLGYRDTVSMQDQSILRFLLENNGKQVAKPEFPEDMIMKAGMASGMFNQEMGFKPCEDQEFQFISSGPVDLDCLWNY